MPKRSFVKRNGKARIKENIPNFRHVFPNAESRAAQQFYMDIQIIEHVKHCSFIRPHIPGEFEGMGLSGDELVNISWVYVIANPSPDHVASHLKAMKGDQAIGVFDMFEDTPIHARVLLTEDQANRIKAAMGREDSAFYKITDGKIERLHEDGN